MNRQMPHIIYFCDYGSNNISGVTYLDLSIFFALFEKVYITAMII